MKKNIIIAILAVLLAVCLWFLMKKPKHKESIVTRSNPPKTQIIYTDKDSAQHLQQKVVPTPEISQSITNNYHTFVSDTLAPALKIATEKTNELTRIKARLEGELQATKMEITKEKTERVYYENKYLSIVTESDTLGKPKNLKYQYNAELNIAHFSKRKNFFSKEEHFIDVSSPDKNFKVNGLEHFQKQIIIRPKSVGIGFQAGYGFSQEMKPMPYLGFGVSWNLIRL